MFVGPVCVAPVFVVPVFVGPVCVAPVFVGPVWFLVDGAICTLTKITAAARRTTTPMARKPYASSMSSAFT